MEIELKEQFDKLREIVCTASAFSWVGGGIYDGPINPSGIAVQTPGPKFSNWFILAEHVPETFMGEGFEESQDEIVVMAGLDQNLEFADWDLSTKTLGGINAILSDDGTMTSLVHRSRPSGFITWRMLYQ